MVVALATVAGACLMWWPTQERRDMALMRAQLQRHLVDPVRMRTGVDVSERYLEIPVRSLAFRLETDREFREAQVAREVARVRAGK